MVLCVADPWLKRSHKRKLKPPKEKKEKKKVKKTKKKKKKSKHRSDDDDDDEFKNIDRECDRALDDARKKVASAMSELMFVV